MSLAQQLEDLDAVVQRHVHIQDDDLVVAACAELQPAVAVERGGDGESMRLQEIKDELRARLIVVHDENPIPTAHEATLGRSCGTSVPRYLRTCAPNVLVSIGLEM